ncbi:hypothetical protein MNEG_10793 [Monoraphidium neglectum]|uniref:Zinc-finger domain-containing protein n=1 Tax=Monoraphidium neglectum TaxID=145388 RepID=A0A0D2KNH3_9CHLO|nr:hypothetical protein MNEG_10793 [Monoraphidium neglectum]KIY97168.1 hypothetical protein MNEG_10793 [Monoraphidium neglectum]|eukprot:XP_013896188.1 hypothetical protein MNEG_10793 [Monoraphidium neglectum]
MALDLLQRAAPSRPSPLNKYELERQERIEANRRRMEELGVLETARNLMVTINAAKPQRPFQQRNPRMPRVVRPRKIRRSGRNKGRKGPDYSALNRGEVDPSAGAAAADGDGEGAAAGGAEGEGEGGDAASSDWEGSELDDLLAGITCHFCRQKKLCGEDGCPRCSRRSMSAECIGKSDWAAAAAANAPPPTAQLTGCPRRRLSSLSEAGPCGAAPAASPSYKHARLALPVMTHFRSSRCHGATGRFCRACLLLRYGQTIEEAREQMAAGTWLCPHCYEAEHPADGWMCNSSICMKRRGFKSVAKAFTCSPPGTPCAGPTHRASPCGRLT